MQAVRRNTHEDKGEGIMTNTTSILQDWQRMGIEAFNAGEKRHIPYTKWATLFPSGQKVGSPESKMANKKMEAWIRGWDKANIESTIETLVPTN